MNKNFKYFFLVILNISFFYTQVNTESIRSNLLENGTFNKINVDFDYDNIDSNEFLNIKLGYRFDIISPNYTAFIQLKYENGYKNADGIRDVINNKGFCHIRYTKEIIKNYFFETFTQYEFNDFLKIEDRYLLGLGTRIKFDFIKNNPIYLGLGIMNEIEKYDSDEDKNLIRSTNYISNNTKINDKITLSNIIYFQLDLADANDFRVLYDASINLETIKNLYLNFGINYRYDNDPHEDFSQSYTQLLSGISYNF